MAKPESWGFSGGRNEFPNHPSITVKNLTFHPNGNDQILLVRERFVESKPLKTDKTFEQALIDMGNLIAKEQSKKSPITWDKINYLLNTVIPKPKRFMNMVKALFIKSEAGDWKIDPALANDWDQDSERNKIILTAIREELEETGLLINPEPLVEFPTGRNHKLVVCYTTEIISGRLKKESKEIHETQWFALDQLPPVPDEDENISKPYTMYTSHKYVYLPKALMTLREKGIPIPCAPEVIDAFLDKAKKFRARPKQPITNPAQ